MRYAETIIEFLDNIHCPFLNLKHYYSENEICLSLQDGDKTQSSKRCVLNKK
jgi:hypothetical protein